MIGKPRSLSESFPNGRYMMEYFAIVLVFALACSAVLIFMKLKG
jgi:preprotein translocase subunit SecE